MLGSLALAVRMMVVLVPPPRRKKDIPACEGATLLAFNMAEDAETRREAQAALRLRCRRCQFRERSPILGKPKAVAARV